MQLIFFYLAVMESLYKNMVTPELEILVFQQSGGETLKDSLYRIKDLHARSEQKCSISALLRKFYIVMFAWFKYVLVTII